MSYTAKIVHMKEVLLRFYQTNTHILLPVFKAVFALVTLLVMGSMFPYGTISKYYWIYFLAALVQAFLPITLLYFMASAVILASVWHVSLDIMGIFAIYLLICLLVSIRVDFKYTVIMMLTPILFVYKLEYFLPVALGMTVGYGGILPCVAGIVLYFLSRYTADASALIITSADSELGTGVQRVFAMISIDKYLVVVLLAFALVILMAFCINRILYERAWVLALFSGNMALALIMLLGQYFFELEFSILRLFIEVILSIGLGALIQLFRGLGDVSRIERVSFEDDEYIYYVKAVPKIRMAHKEVNQKIIR